MVNGTLALIEAHNTSPTMLLNPSYGLAIPDSSSKSRERQQIHNQCYSIPHTRLCILHVILHCVPSASTFLVTWTLPCAHWCFKEYDTPMKLIFMDVLLYLACLVETIPCAKLAPYVNSQLIILDKEVTF